MDRLITSFFLGFATSAALHFTSAVHFNVQPVNTLAMVGNSVVLHCALDEMLLVGETQHWVWTNQITGKNVTLTTNRKTEAGLPPELSRRLSIFGNRMHAEYNLRIDAVTKSEQGIYRCLLHIRQTQEYIYSRPATLTVESLSDRVPVCDSTPIHPLPGSQIVLTCRAGSHFSADVIWMLGNVRLRSTLVRQGNRLTAVLRRNVYEQDNFAVFKCFERSRSGGVVVNVGQCSVTPLRVETIVKITPRFVSLSEYKDTVLKCFGESLPPVTFYEWIIDELMVINTPNKLLLSDRNRQLTIKAEYLRTLDKPQLEIRCTAGNTLISSTVNSASIQLILPKKTSTTLKPLTTINSIGKPIETTHRLNVKLSTEKYISYSEVEHIITTLMPTLKGEKLPQKVIQGVAIISASVLGIIIFILVCSIVLVFVFKKKKRLLEISNYNTVAEQPLASKKAKQYENEIVTPRMKYCHKVGSCQTLQPPRLPDRDRYVSKQRRHISEHFNANGKILGVNPQRRSEYIRKSSGGSRGEGDGSSGDEAQKCISLYENAIAIRLSYLNDYSKRFKRVASQHSYDDVEPLAVYDNPSDSIYEVS